MGAFVQIHTGFQEGNGNIVANSDPLLLTELLQDFPGVRFDLFHIGHLTLLKNAKGLCDKLIVGVTVDELVTYKGKHAIIPFSDRIEIVRSIKYVDAAVPQYDMDKLAMCKKLGASILFVGDDWYGTDKWREYEKEFAEAGVRIVYFPYTRGVSSTQVSKALAAVRGQEGKKEEGQ